MKSAALKRSRFRKARDGGENRGDGEPEFYLRGETEGAGAEGRRRGVDVVNAGVKEGDAEAFVFSSSSSLQRQVGGLCRLRDSAACGGARTGMEAGSYGCIRCSPSPLPSKVTSPPPKQSGSSFKGWFLGNLKGFFLPPQSVHTANPRGNRARRRRPSPTPTSLPPPLLPTTNTFPVTTTRTSKTTLPASCPRGFAPCSTNPLPNQK